MEESVLDMRVLPLDVEVRFVQQAYYQHYFELGRWDLGVRSGMVGLMFRKKWSFALGGQMVSYHRPLKRFQKFQVHTRILGVDDQWIYMRHKIMSDDKLISSALVKLTCREGKTTVSPQTLSQFLEHKDLPTQLPEDVVKWKNAESLLCENHLLKSRPI